MNISGKKELLDGEAVLYTPKAHWVVLLRPCLLFCFFFMFLLAEFLLQKLMFDAAWLLHDITGIVLAVNAVCVACYLIWQILAFFSVEYYITNKRLILKKGLFSSVLIDMPIQKIESVFCSQNLWGKVFGYGTVYVSGIGGMLPRYSTIHKPYVTRRILNIIIEKNKRITIVKELPVRKAVEKKPAPKPVIEYGTFIVYPSVKNGS